MALVVDETSFMRDKENQKLDMNLRNMTGRKYFLYGGILVIFIGDFFQIPPQGKIALYHNISLQWSSLNTVIFLENAHRFRNDPVWGVLLSRFRVGKYIDEDIEKINARWLGGDNKIDFPRTKDSMDTCHACSRNKKGTLLKCLYLKNI